ncbi:hypothetical protein B0H19DRAFT_1385274 [Mycena capillaripes]|nr:hypothetical protein B0H19DRAFT_1385274 [Mycena capillaripes]
MSSRDYPPFPFPLPPLGPPFAAYLRSCLPPRTAYTLLLALMYRLDEPRPIQTASALTPRVAPRASHSTFYLPNPARAGFASRTQRDYPAAHDARLRVSPPLPRPPSPPHPDFTSTIFPALSVGPSLPPRSTANARSLRQCPTWYFTGYLTYLVGFTLSVAYFITF